ncbi:MAG: 50S ribosomal protein L3 N(5)-glutamine methyltransferase [Gammaproteobacteria bacterium]|nr:50S ribosomal protein L3 N(5)-glutamine methyltransferase [Gammaproteobacteria bacterium]MDH4310214.1 50S ribosomal protein L3 N(5)-glutamine methyltransferase [Gammaproteobacteria bacterium]MDH5273552.1 50S ribosomal protein L3 N(5)-glutamine methyltransferase [Gammaproteobacteria bacterium]
MPTTLSPFTRRPPAAPTVAQLIRFGAREFDAAGLAYGHGTADARDDAAALVFHALGLDHAAAKAAYATRPAKPRVDQVLGLFAERLRRRVPVAYLMGRMWFAGHEFEVDERVIVPRSPFAELIARGFAPWIEAGRVRRVVDLGTGSGCIAIACALRFPQAQVDAVELSPDALAVAARNVRRHGVGARLHLHLGDLFEPLGDAVYDLIVSNPPYVSDAEMDALPGEYLHEPDMALRAGGDGLDVVRRILRDADAHLAPGGILVVEVGDSDERLQRAYPGVPFLWLELEHGGGGVFLLTKDDLHRHRRELSGAG